MKALALGAAAAALGFGGAFLAERCSGAGAATLVTDRPEFAFYAERFNAAHRERIEVRWAADAASAPAGDILVFSGLSPKALRPLDHLFDEGRVDASLFYPALLEAGRSGGAQVLIPVSFNLPALACTRSFASALPAKADLEPAELQALAAAYNERAGDGFSRMGFAPRWDAGFLLALADLEGACFRASALGADRLAWNGGALDAALAGARRWTAGANASAAAEDDFAFRWLYGTPERNLATGKALFAYRSSADLLSGADRSLSLDYRWLSRDGRIQALDGAEYLGFVRGRGDPRAAEAFVSWFFRPGTQRALLEEERRLGLFDQGFGIAGGFSSIEKTSAEDFQDFYPSLKGRVPRSGRLGAPPTPPARWKAMKDRVLLPYLLDRAEDAARGAGLEERLARFAEDPRKVPLK